MKSDYVEGPPCNLALHKVQRDKNEEDNLNDIYGYDLVQFSKRIMQPWTNEEREYFNKIPEALKQAELLRLLAKYKSPRKKG